VIPAFAYRVGRTWANTGGITPPAGITIVSSSTGGAESGSCVYPAPAGITAGMFLYAFITCDDTAETTPSMACSGWTRDQFIIYSTHNDTSFIIGFYKWATASEPSSYTFAGSTADAQTGAIVAMSGVNATTPFNVASVAKKGTSSTSAVFGPITPSGNAMLLVCAAQASNYSSSVSNAITWASPVVSVANSTSIYNQEATEDAEALYVGTIPATTYSAAYTVPTATYNKSYYSGTLVVALNHA
jgi:hypothetical protein